MTPMITCGKYVAARQIIVAARASLLGKPNEVRMLVMIASVVPSPPGGTGINVASLPKENATKAYISVTGPSNPPCNATTARYRIEN